MPADPRSPARGLALTALTTRSVLAVLGLSVLPALPWMWSLARDLGVALGQSVTGTVHWVIEKIVDAVVQFVVLAASGPF